MRIAIPVLIITCCSAVALLCLAGCTASRTATVRITTTFTNDMVYIPEEEQEPEPEPEPTTYTVKAGDYMDSEAIRVLKVTEDSIKIHMEDWDYYGNQGEVGRDFTVQLGETLRLTMAGLLDATSTTTVELVSIEENA